jgi:DtxR family Mn-dependent transcriptional regulator
MTQPLTIAVVLIALLALLFGLAALAWRWRRLRRRVLWEDALKQVCTAKSEGRSMTSHELAGRLGLAARAGLRLNEEMEAAGLMRSHGEFLELTETGERLGLHVLRGHRLWERYLADEARLPLDQLHAAAERAEHRLTEDEVVFLADHLGHPRTDPHGDLIPPADGKMLAQKRTPLTDWPRDRPAVVVHVEDEPREALDQILRAGLGPGTGLRVTEKKADAIVCETAAGRCVLAPAVAALVDVVAAGEGVERALAVATLAELPLGQSAEVSGLSEGCTGLRRRRLLDLGFTPGARVEAVLSNVQDSAHAYRIRETLIALREEQAKQVLIRRPAAPSRQQADRRR